MQEQVLVPITDKLKEAKQNLGSCVRKASGIAVAAAEVEMGRVYEVEKMHEIIADMYLKQDLDYMGLRQLGQKALH